MTDRLSPEQELVEDICRVVSGYGDQYIEWECDPKVTESERESYRNDIRPIIARHVPLILRTWIEGLTDEQCLQDLGFCEGTSFECEAMTPDTIRAALLATLEKK